MFTLRDDQHAVVDRIRACIGGGHRRVLLTMPTGSGKTVVASHIIYSAMRKRNRVLFLAHTRELVHQCSDKLRLNDVRHGIIMAGFPRDPGELVQVASKDTLHARVVRRDVLEAPEAQLLVLDEAHRSVSKTWTDLVGRYPEAVVLGLTATPARNDGRGLADIYQVLVMGAKYADLIRAGNLVPTRVFAPSMPDLKGVRVERGDYNRGQVEKKMNRTELVGGIVHHWMRLAKDRRTIVFASGISHSMHICEQFQRAGVECDHIDGEMDSQERDWYVRKFHDGRLQMLCNCMVLTEGFDAPECSCAILACPTRSIVKYRQMAGRIQRPAPGKEDALIIDHAGAVWEHGFPDEDLPWRLERTHRLDRRRRREEEPRSVICKNCFAVFTGCQYCPECGCPVPRRAPRRVEHRRGNLDEVRRREAMKNSTHQQRQRFFDQCLGLCIGQDHKIAKAAAMYKNRFGILPWQHRGNNRLTGLPNYDEWQMKGREFYALKNGKEAHNVPDPTAASDLGGH